MDWKKWRDDRQVALVVWSVGMLLTFPTSTLPDAMLAFAAVVLVPMGLRLIGVDQPTRMPELQSDAFGTIRFVAAILLMASYKLPQGLWAGVLATPWAGVTYWLTLCGLSRRLANLRTWDYTSIIDVGSLFIAVGGTFTILTRLGVRVNDFSDEIILLTAVHFHYAGFILPLIAAWVVRKFPEPLSYTAALACLFFTVLLAVGINFSPHVEVVAAVGLASGCVLLAIIQLVIGARSGHPHMLVMLGISSLAMLGAMALAITYAVGQFQQAKWIDIPTMAKTHGIANAFGFAYCGLWGWEAEFRRKLARK